MTLSILLLASIRLVIPPGTADDPSAVAPLSPTSEPVKIWYDDDAFHAGDESFGWKTLGVEPKDGATFKVSVRGPGSDTTEISGVMEKTAPKFRLDCFGAIGNAFVSNRVEVTANRTIQLTSQLRANGATPDYLMQRATKTFKSGTRGFIDIIGKGPSSGMCYYALFDNAGRIYYHINGKFHDPKLLFDFKYLWTEPEKMRLWVRTGGWIGGDGGYTMRVSMKDLLSDTLGSWSKTAAIGAIDGEKEYPFDVSDLPSGFYWAHVDYLDKNGQVVHSDKARFMKPDEKMPWDDTALGTEDTVPPPWTKPEFGDDGVFRCWNRTIRLGGDGIVSSIVNSGKEMLTSPVALAVDGRKLSFDVKLSARRNSDATYVLKAKVADVEVKVSCEFDGYLRFDASYSPPVEKLEWIVPVDRRLVTGLDDCSAEGNPDARFAKTGRIERFFDVDAKPQWWMPGLVGLMGGMLNLHGTHIRNLDKAGHVLADGDTLQVSVSLVDCPLPAGGRRTVSFYLEPTPVKPKDRVLSSIDSSRLIGWTGHLCQFFEARYPGFEDMTRFKPYVDFLKQGKRVFFYNGTRGESPESPFWGWYRRDWTFAGIDTFAREAPLLTASARQHNNWTCGCLAEKGFFEHKIWGVNWYLNGPVPEMKDLYFDLANPRKCSNKRHPCVWKDDFGRTINDWSTAPLRELHKRAYRLVKAKNPDGAMYGHIGSRRYPGDVFFDVISTGESLAIKVQKNYNYFEIFTPEMMQSYFVPRAQEIMVFCPPQLLRSRECWAPDLYRTYDCNTPENVRAIRHCIAYIKIHDMRMPRGPDHREGPQFFKVDAPVCRLGPGRRYSAYFHEGELPVSVTRPMDRFLWSWHRNDHEGVLILLNDTDETVTETVSVTGLSTQGTELLDGGKFDFTNGTCTIAFPPRDARFIRFSF